MTDRNPDQERREQQQNPQRKDGSSRDKQNVQPGRTSPAQAPSRNPQDRDRQGPRK